MTKKYVLNVEGVLNWNADKAASFSTLGFSDLRSFFESLTTGDVIITYVKGHGFVDLREIAVPGVLKLGLKGHYPEGAFPWQIRTRPVACIALNEAVSPNRFPQTKLCAGTWRYRFQQSGRLIDFNDGRVIADALVKAARRPARRPHRYIPVGTRSARARSGCSIFLSKAAQCLYTAVKTCTTMRRNY